ncbi:MAG: EamA family transporter, partial [Pseudomonadota bacterium]
MCVLTAVSIWGWWMSATRIAAQQGVAPIDVALLRYAVPAILLLPFLPQTLKKLTQAPWWSTLALLGWGAPFLWLVTASLQQANVVYLATIVPCTMPLFAVTAERLFFKNRLTTQQLTGFALIAAAALLIITSALSGNDGITLYSLVLMLWAAMGWACYVVAFKH